MGIGDHHHWHSSSYVDDWIDGATSHDEQRRPVLHQAARLLPFAAEAPVRVLDLGSGYGEFSAQVLGLFPRASVCLADYSVPMLERAKQRLVGFGDRVEFRVCDLRDPAWTTQVGGVFDAVVSSLTIHNLGEPVAIRRAFVDVAGLLCPGGCFFDLDLVLDARFAPATSALGELYARGAPSHHFGPDTDEHHHELDPNVVVPTLEDHLCWPREGGFVEVDCVW
ncbi:MAG: class I SAM-dependent methyltransferase, partial [Pseudonocardiaceae bacterium]